MKKKCRPTFGLIDMTASWMKYRGWSLRRCKKHRARMCRRVAMYSKRCRSNHRVWTFAARELLRHGTVYWAVRDMHHRQPVLSRSTDR